MVHHLGFSVLPGDSLYRACPGSLSRTKPIHQRPTEGSFATDKDRRTQNRRAHEASGGFENGYRRAPQGRARLLVRLGLAQADHFVALLVLTAFLEDFDALETLQDVTLRGDGALAFETAVLRHKKCGYRVK